MEDSAVVFEEFRNTAGVMEEEGLLPNVQKEEMEQGETGVKPTGMDIRGEEELEVAGEGLGHKVMTHREKLSDLDPVDQIRMEEEFETPPRKGDQRKWTGFQTDGSRDKIFDLGLVPDYAAAQSMGLTDQNRPGNTLSPVENLEETVLRIKRDMEDLQTENRFLRTRRIPGRPRRSPGSMVPQVGNNISRCLMRLLCRTGGVMRLQHCSCCHIFKGMP